MELKGSQTEKNLEKSFAGESMARNKYTYFSSQAKKEGLEQISAIFHETADNEKEHAKRMYKFLNDGQVSKTVENLKKAAAGENAEWTTIYPEFAKTARAEGFEEIAVFYEELAKAEKEHNDRYNKLIQNIDNNEVFKRNSKKRWICRNCGRIIESEEAPKSCPLCNHAQSYFELKAENY